MDFIEKLTGLAPDAGTGAAELFWIMTPILLGFAFVCREQIQRLLSMRKPSAGERQSVK